MLEEMMDCALAPGTALHVSYHLAIWLASYPFGWGYGSGPQTHFAMRDLSSAVAVNVWHPAKVHQGNRPNLQSVGAGSGYPAQKLFDRVSCRRYQPTSRVPMISSF